MDLFATQPPPPIAPEYIEARDKILEAAQAVEEGRRGRVEAAHRRTRSQAGGVPFKTGPISDATGGPLSAAEATRVLTGLTIRCSGYEWADGTTCCKTCFDTVIRNGDDAGHGYRSVLYGGAEYRGGKVCFACKQPIAP